MRGAHPSRVGLGLLAVPLTVGIVALAAPGEAQKPPTHAQVGTTAACKSPTGVPFGPLPEGNSQAGDPRPLPQRIANARKPGGAETTFYADPDTYTVNQCGPEGSFRKSTTVRTVHLKDGRTAQVEVAAFFIGPDGTLTGRMQTYDPESPQFQAAIDSPKGQADMQSLPEPSDR